MRESTSSIENPVRLTFGGGPETRRDEVEVYEKSGECSPKTKASENISGTESYARSVLQPWNECRLAGEDMGASKRKCPGADATVTMDIAWASMSSAGKRLARYEVTNAHPAPKGFRFAVAATIKDRGTLETKVAR